MEWSEVYILLEKYWPQCDCPEEYDAFMEEVCSISGWTLPEIRAKEEADLKALQDAVADRYAELVEIGLDRFVEKHT